MQTENRKLVSAALTNFPCSLVETGRERTCPVTTSPKMGRAFHKLDYSFQLRPWCPTEYLLVYLSLPVSVRDQCQELGVNVLPFGVCSCVMCVSVQVLCIQSPCHYPNRLVSLFTLYIHVPPCYLHHSSPNYLPAHLKWLLLLLLCLYTRLF